MIGWLKLTTSEANSERLVLLQFWKEVFRLFMSFHLWPFDHTIYIIIIKKNKNSLKLLINLTLEYLKYNNIIESTIGLKAIPG